MNGQRRGVDAVMAEYVNWGGPIITRAEAYRSAVAEGFSGRELDYVVFARTSPGRRSRRRTIRRSTSAFHRRIEAMRGAERDEAPTAERRTVTVQFLAWEEIDSRPTFAHNASRRGEFRPVTHREWLAIERKCSKPFRYGLRHPANPHGSGAPKPRLADGRLVSDVLDARHERGAAA